MQLPVVLGSQALNRGGEIRQRIAAETVGPHAGSQSHLPDRLSLRQRRTQSERLIVTKAAPLTVPDQLD